MARIPVRIKEASSETTLAALTRRFTPVHDDPLAEMSQKRREDTATVQGDRFPMPDVKHARLALQMLSRAKGLSDDDRAKIRKRAESIIAQGHV